VRNRRQASPDRRSLVPWLKVDGDQSELLRHRALLKTSEATQWATDAYVQPLFSAEQRANKHELYEELRTLIQATVRQPLFLLLSIARNQCRARTAVARCEADYKSSKGHPAVVICAALVLLMTASSGPQNKGSEGQFTSIF